MFVLGLIIAPFFSVAQSQRTVLIEQFNNVGCDSCASANSYIDALEGSNPGKMNRPKIPCIVARTRPF